MSPDEELTLVLGSIKEYATYHKLDAQEIVDIFSEGAIHYAMPDFKSPLLEGNLNFKPKPVVSLKELRLKKEELKETLKWVPDCQAQRRDELLDQIIELSEQIHREVRKRDKIG